jgi:excisionase family DNA binding protein
MPKLVTIQEAARYIGGAVSVSTLRRLAERGEIVAVRFGGAPVAGDGPATRAGRLLFDPADLDDYIKRQKTTLAPAYRAAGPSADLVDVIPKIRRFA